MQTKELARVRQAIAMLREVENALSSTNQQRPEMVSAAELLPEAPTPQHWNIQQAVPHLVVNITWTDKEADHPHQVRYKTVSQDPGESYADFLSTVQYTVAALEEENPDAVTKIEMGYYQEPPRLTTEPDKAPE